MPTKQGSLDLLNDPVAQTLLQSTNLAHFAYNWSDGTPRVVPIWFHWNGQEVVIASPADAPKAKVLNNAKVALTIDDPGSPYKVLLIRGTARATIVEGIAPEYAAAAVRYNGVEGGEAWIKQVEPLVSKMARVAITPEWVAVQDFERRFPNALERAMGM
jgi:hypothetical protein